MKTKYEINMDELLKLRNTYKIAFQELEFLRKKDEVFQQADSDKGALIEKMNNYEQEIERLKNLAIENDFSIKVLTKENEQIKDEILNSDSVTAKIKLDNIKY